MDVDFDPSWLASHASASSTPAALKPYYTRFANLYERRLWYQLTLALDEFLSLPDATPQAQIDLYQKFIVHFEKKINQLSRAAIAVKVARQHATAREALDFLSSIIASVAPSQPSSTAAEKKPASSSADAEENASATQQQTEAYIFLSMEAGHFHLLEAGAAGERYARTKAAAERERQMSHLEETKSTMDKCGKLLDSFDSVESGVSASYYRVCGDYHKAKAEYAPYYKNSLLYLACVSLERDLSLRDQQQRAHDLALSALLGDTIYNFGELLLHPILSTLLSTEDGYLVALLHAFNTGDLGRFEALWTEAKAKEVILAGNEPFLRQKICLMALIESVFKRNAEDRTISFEQIAAETRLPADEVEHLVMKALSLKLIRGTMDQHARVARISWVQPRVLDRPQIEALQARLAGWCDKVKEVGEFVKGQSAHELLGSA